MNLSAWVEMIQGIDQVAGIFRITKQIPDVLCGALFILFRAPPNVSAIPLKEVCAFVWLFLSIIYFIICRQGETRMCVCTYTSP